jgi:hypothetical protein
MSILTEQAFPLPRVVSNHGEGYYELQGQPGLTKLELFTLHAMVAVTGTYQGELGQNDYDHIGRVSRLIARATLLALEETKPHI